MFNRNKLESVVKLLSFGEIRLIFLKSFSSQDLSLRLYQVQNKRKRDLQ